MALIGAVGGLLLVALAALRALPAALVAVAALAVAAVAGWQGLVRAGRTRATSWVGAAILVVGVIAWLLVDGVQWIGLLGVGPLVLAIVAGERAFSEHDGGLDPVR